MLKSPARFAWGENTNSRRLDPSDAPSVGTTGAHKYAMKLHYIPTAGPFVPVKRLVSVLPKLTYQLYFDSKLDAAVAELDRDIRRTIRATLRTVDSPPPDAYLRSDGSFLDAWNHVDEIQPVPFFSSEEEDYFVEQYGFQGFKYTLAVYPLHDPVADWKVAAQVLKTADFVPNLTMKVLQGAHWVHIEYPVEFNAIVREWLRHVDESDSSSKMERDSRVVDEL
ncbi:hypothetical protein C0995_000277 [Termitomyces sp. Mi166|nr:hypothetical protein C0995_000277 [Termitomyces sp. Mi166\